MGRLIYCLNVSLDGFVETRDKGLEWGRVDDELHAWFADHARSIEASLYGRRLYETMTAYWPTAEQDPNATDAMLDFARIWNATPRLVFSRTLETVLPGDRLVAGDVAERLAEARAEFGGDLEVGGATLASQFVERGLVDEFRLLVHPVAIGGGTPFWPSLERELGLRLSESRTFATGVVYLGYRAADR